MTTGGWINLILSVGFVTVLFVWSLIRVLREPPESDKHLAHVEPIEEDQTEQR
ncbi:MAG: hypothetical protein IPP19_09220 [Verrucomicrobia bacterium]|nr:hypothetical protein [Verrucomicrobiota bacterium]